MLSPPSNGSLPVSFGFTLAAAAAIFVAASPAIAANNTGTSEASEDNKASKAPPLVEFGGEVARGDTLVHRFKHGDASFEFRLVPLAGGWTIWIGDPARRDSNFVAVATGPLHGVNPAVIDGWHFRNADNTGPNEPGEKNVNAPGMERGFAFVLDAAGYGMAFAAREIALAGSVDGTAEQPQQSLPETPTATGKLTIRALELGNLAPNQRAVVDRMAFVVSLQFPG